VNSFVQTRAKYLGIKGNFFSLRSASDLKMGQNSTQINDLLMSKNFPFIFKSVRSA